MNNIFSVLLLVTFSFSIISCSNEDPTGATSQLDQVLDQPNSTDDRNFIDLPDITLDSCYLIDNSTIDNSTVDKSSISDNSSIKDSTVINCSTVTNSIVDNSTIDNSTTCDSYIDNSTIVDSTVCYDNVSFRIVDETILNRIMTEQTDPTVSSVAITYGFTMLNSRLNAWGDFVVGAAEFSEPVFVDNLSVGYPTLTIAVGSDNRTATYWHTSIDNTTLIFKYTIQAGDNDTNGISIGANSIALNGGTIRDASGNYAIITHDNVTDNNSYMVDTTAPTLLDNVSVTSSTASETVGGHAKQYINAGGADENGYSSVCTAGNCYVFMTTTFSEPVLVDSSSGHPTLTIVIAGANRTATYRSGNETSRLVFQYAIQPGDSDLLDTNGISIGTNALSLNSSWITDLAGHGNYATITHSAVGDNSNFQVKDW